MPKPINSTRRTGNGSSFVFNPLGPASGTQGLTGYGPSYGTTNPQALIGSVVTRAQVDKVVQEAQQKLQADAVNRFRATHRRRDWDDATRKRVQQQAQAQVNSRYRARTPKREWDPKAAKRAAQAEQDARDREAQRERDREINFYRNSDGRQEYYDKDTRWRKSIDRNTAGFSGQTNQKVTNPQAYAANKVLRESGIEGALVSSGRAVVPSGAGIVGSSIGAELGLLGGPLAPVTVPLGMIAGGALASYWANRAQDEALRRTGSLAGLNAVEDEFARKHPWLHFGLTQVPNLLFEHSVSPRAVASYGRNVVKTAATEGGKAAAKTVAASAGRGAVTFGMGAGIDLGFQAWNGQPIDLGHAAGSGLSALVQSGKGRTAAGETLHGFGTVVGRGARVPIALGGRGAWSGARWLYDNYEVDPVASMAGFGGLPIRRRTSGSGGGGFWSSRFGRSSRASAPSPSLELPSLVKGAGKVNNPEPRVVSTTGEPPYGPPAPKVIPANPFRSPVIQTASEATANSTKVGGAHEGYTTTLPANRKTGERQGSEFSPVPEQVPMEPPPPQWGGFSRTRLADYKNIKRAIQAVFGYDAELSEADAIWLESFARGWASENNKTPADYYHERFKGLTKGDSELAKAIGGDGTEQGVTLSGRGFAQLLNLSAPEPVSTKLKNQTSAVIAAFSNPGPRTFLHESGHLIFNDLPNSLKDSYLRSIGETRASDGQLTDKAKEMFATALEDNILRGGESALHPSLLPVYERFQRRLRGAYPVFGNLYAVPRRTNLEATSQGQVYWNAENDGHVQSGRTKPFHPRVLWQLRPYFGDVTDLTQKGTKANE